MVFWHKNVLILLSAILSHSYAHEPMQPNVLKDLHSFGKLRPMPVLQEYCMQQMVRKVHIELHCLKGITLNRCFGIHIPLLIEVG
jgi:hypothetical protein